MCSPSGYENAIGTEKHFVQENYIQKIVSISVICIQVRRWPKFDSSDEWKVKNDVCNL